MMRTGTEKKHKKALARAALSLLLSAAAVFFCGCEGEGTRGDGGPVQVIFPEAFEMRTADDGWVYTFCHDFNKDGSEISDRSIYTSFFRAFNIRYAYTDGTESTFDIGGGTPLGRDMKKISELLYSEPLPRKEDLLAVDRESVAFEAIDGDMFFDMMTAALNGRAHPVGNWSVYPEHGLLREQGYEDGYAFQFGFVCECGVFEASFIDVLYPADGAPCGYVQLSDMVDAGTATGEESELFRVLSEISGGITGEDDLYFGDERYKGETLASVDLGRLYAMFEKIDAEDGIELLFRKAEGTPESEELTDRRGGV